MGHAIEMFSFPYGTKQSKILAEIQEWASYTVDRQENPSGSYHGNFKLLENREFKTKEEAEKWLEQLDSYVDRGVIYYEYPKIEPKSAMKKLKESADKLKALGEKYATDHCVQNQKADFIGCKKCGSKINKKCITQGYDGHIKNNKMAELRGGYSGEKYYFQSFGQQCPVCKGDLRADYIQAKLDEYAEKINEINKKYKELEKAMNEKNFKKAKKMWLCKAEVHC